MAKKPVKGEKRAVCCTYCGEPIEVSRKALSVFCPHCQKRVVCEDYTIKSYHAVRSFATCGDIVVEKKGHVVAPIRAESLIVRGRVRGNVQVKSVVKIERTGRIEGNVEAPRLVMRDGGTLIGACRIVTNGTPAPNRPAGKKNPAGPWARKSAPAPPKTSAPRQAAGERT